MPDVLSAAVKGVAAVLKQCRGQPIVYTSGSDRVGFTASRGQARRETADDAGLAITVDRQTFVFEATALAFPEGLRLPAAGDRITTTGPAAQVFEVLPYDARKPPYDFPDPDRRLIRVYTRQVS